MRSVRVIVELCKGNMAMYNLAQRNRYLEKKIEALRGEYEKQTRMFHRLGEKARAHWDATRTAMSRGITNC